LQQESGTEMDTLVSGVNSSKHTVKKKGYSYIYGTGDAASVLYAEDKYDITKDIIKALNDKYKSIRRKKRRKKAEKNRRKEISFFFYNQNPFLN
jgi:outer membrane protein